ncbi:5,6-dimethylbenzimidazole synthase [Zavarzinia sp. CC-PAN008]|uniref:5,6-dimethylbenzimidazole synthase n=1 Tax=Zavarzinia sp. CC-PAN008 TaxID=3243332 RepID=UPI003F749692
MTAPAARREGAPSFDAAFQEGLGRLLAWRRDVRHFFSDPLPRGLLEELLAAAHTAPSVGNSRPWRFVRLVSADRRAALAAHVDAQVAVAAAAYPPGSPQRERYDGLKLHGVREAPELLAVFCETQPQAGHGLGRATMPETLDYSVVLAIHTLWLAARARGIGLGWVSILEPAFVHSLVQAPAHWRFIAVLCLGLPAEPLPEPELAQRGWQADSDWREHLSEA